MSRPFHAFAAQSAGSPLTSYEFNPGPLGPGQVEIEVTHCGICHSDLSMINNEWGLSQYPLVPGHEIVGRIVDKGEHALRVNIGDLVGLGWFSGSCCACQTCLGGDHNLCASAEQTIVGRHGGFADRVRANWEWAIPIPKELDPATAGPLFCGGITVFNPIIECGVRATHRTGVVGIGGLGHLALQFLNKWGCEVTAFTSNEAKREEAISFGAHHVANTRDSSQLASLAGSLDFLLVTANVTLDWDALIGTLAPKGRLHFVGAVLEPIPVAAFSLISAQRSLSGSPLGSPATTGQMLEFCARHGIAPKTETFPFTEINEALAHLSDGKARYRVVLERRMNPA